jgi:hypothetical protein
LIVRNAWGSDTIVQTNQVFVGSVPSANFTYVISNDTVTFTNNSVDENGVLWVFGDGTNSSVSDPIHIYAPGTYTVTLAASNACGAALYEQTITIISSIEALATTSKIRIAPNPDTQVAYLLGLELAKVYQLELFDAASKRCISKEMVGGQSSEIDLEALPAGVYRCVITPNTGKAMTLNLVKN